MCVSGVGGGGGGLREEVGFLSEGFSRLRFRALLLCYDGTNRVFEEEK